MLLSAPSPGAARDAGRSLYRTALDVVLTGFAVILPLVVTVYVLNAALGIVTGALNPVIKVLQWAGLIEGVKDVGVVQLLIELGLYSNVIDFLTELIAVFILVVSIVVIGVVARNRHGERIIDYFDFLITAIPGVGAVYKSFRRMGDTMLAGDTQSFQEVKLVEFPTEGSYVIGFETNSTPDRIRDAAGVDEEMVTLFLPLAPNPVMGGHLVNLSVDRVCDVDLSVEEGMQAIVTTGMAVDEGTFDETGEVADRYSATEQTSHGLTGVAATYVVGTDRVARYEQVAENPADRTYGNWVRYFVRDDYEDPFGK